MPHQQQKINRQFNDQHIKSRHSTNTTNTEHNSNTIFKSSNHHHHHHQNNIVQNLSPIKPSFVKYLIIFFNFFKI